MQALIKKRSKRFYLIIVVILLMMCTILYMRTNIEHDYYESKLSNGLEIAVFEKEELPLTTLIVTFKLGSLYQTPNTTGIFHLIEHLLVRSIEDDLEEMGATISAVTSYDYLYLNITCPNDKWKEALKVTERMLLNPDFDQKSLVIEQDVVKAEYDYRQCNQENHLISMIKKKLWGSLYYKVDIVGEKLKEKKFELDEVQDVYKSFFIPNRTLITVVGSKNMFNYKSDIEALLKKWSKGDSVIEINRNKIKLPLNNHVLLPVDSKQNKIEEDTDLFILLDGPDCIQKNSNDTYVLDVLCQIINQRESVFAKALGASQTIKY